MLGLGVQAMVFAGGPDFVEQEGAGDFEGAVQVVGEAAFFAAGGGDERAKFGFEQRLLAFLGAEDDGQGYGVFGELGGCASSRLAPRCVPFCFALRHRRGDCTPKWMLVKVAAGSNLLVLGKGLRAKSGPELHVAAI
jgi:hypothetical protein